MIPSSCHSNRTPEAWQNSGLFPEKSTPTVIKLQEIRMPAEKAEFYFPKPSGIYPIGIESYALQDSDRTLSSIEKRSIGISVHYPALNRGDPLFYRQQPLEPYFDDLHKLNPRAETGQYATCCSYSQPGVPPAVGSFPVILMAHGHGMCQDDYQPIVEELASQGFCVVTVDSPGVACYSRTSGPQGKVVPAENMLTDAEAMEVQAQDIAFVLESLRNNTPINPHLAALMDTRRVGLIGHSIGGAASAQLCRKDPSIRAGINLDGKLLGANPLAPLSQPFLTISCDRPGTVIENLLPDMKKALEFCQQAKESRESGQIEKADALEAEALTLIETANTAAENFLDVITEFDQFHKNSGRGSYQVSLKDSRHAGFSSVHSLASVVGLSKAAPADHPQKGMYEKWEQQVKNDQCTWAATNQHVIAFFSEHLS